MCVGSRSGLDGGGGRVHDLAEDLLCGARGCAAALEDNAVCTDAEDVVDDVFGEGVVAAVVEGGGAGGLGEGE